MKKTIFAAVIMSVASVNAFAAAPDKDQTSAVVDYHYGQQLDIAKLESLKKSSTQDDVASVIMVYQDHSGQTHQVRFLEESSKANSNG